MMGFAFVALHWTARQFMDATNHELFAAYETYRVMNCSDKD